MVLEIADFTVKAGSEDAFAAAVQEGLPHIAATPGFLGTRGSPAASSRRAASCC